MIPRSLLLPALALAAAGCAASGAQDVPNQPAADVGATVTVRDTVIEGTLDAPGIAQPIERATLSTRLMATVTDVLVQEGDRVRKGQPLVRLDARDLDAKAQQAAAGLAEAEAVHRDAQVQLARMKALYADSAAPKAMLDAAETGAARAEAAVRMARASASELDAVRGYATMVAPFDGVVAQRLVDPGALAAPGAPLVVVEDTRRLRVTVSVPPSAARTAVRGRPIPVQIEGTAATATVEGVVPGPAGTVYQVNAIVPNADGTHLGGSAAVVQLPAGRRHAMLVPARAVVREGDLASVRVREPRGTSVRFVKLGSERDGLVEVLSGLAAGDQVVLRDEGAK